MNEDVLESVYQEKLEERLIALLAYEHEVDYQTAMNAYYSSKLAEKIHEGRYGVQYLDYRVLAEILDDTEPELFKRS